MKVAECNLRNDDCRYLTRTECAACGHPICVKCSRRRVWWRYGRLRICKTCDIESPVKEQR